MGDDEAEAEHRSENVAENTGQKKRVLDCAIGNNTGGEKHREDAGRLQLILKFYTHIPKISDIFTIFGIDIIG